MPSILIKDSDRSKASHVPGASTQIKRRGFVDPADALILRKKELSQLEESSDQKSQFKAETSRLDQYLSRFTSEDNASFSDIHANDKQMFLQKLAILDS